MECCISMLEQALTISCEELKAIEDKDIFRADELFQGREAIMQQLAKIEIVDKILFRDKLQKLQHNHSIIVEHTQKLRGEYIVMLQRSGKEGARLSAYKKIVGQTLL